MRDIEVTDHDSGLTYEAWQGPRHEIGYQCTTAAGSISYLYLVAALGSDDRVPCVFVYHGATGRPGDDEVLHHYNLDAAASTTAGLAAAQPLATLEAEARDWGLTEADLDDLVHDAKGREGSAINNSGIGAQVRYLTEHFGAERARELIRSTAMRGDMP
jgi:hypothetical protein